VSSCGQSHRIQMNRSLYFTLKNTQIIKIGTKSAVRVLY